MTLGSGYRYLMESVAVGDGAPGHTSNLTRYYATSGTPPGVFLGAGLGGLDDGRGVEPGSQVTEQHLFNLLGMCADPITGKALGRQPNRTHLSLAKRVAERIVAIPATHTGTERAEERARIEAEERAKGGTFRTPVAGFDLTFSPSKSVSTAWALADRNTKAQIYACHRRAIEVVLTYAEREVFHSRSGTNGVVQEDIEGAVAAAFTHWDSQGRGSPAPRPCGGGEPRPVGLRRHVADARFPGLVQVRRGSLRAAPGRAQRPVDEGVGVGLGRSGSPALRAAPFRSDRGARGSDGRILPALGRH